MPRTFHGPPLPSTTVLKQLYFQQLKPRSKFAPSTGQVEHEHRARMLAARPKLPVVRTEHFRLGHAEVHFPTQSIMLLRPFSTDYNPYRATFKVPTKFNKLDLLDYLHNIYGLTARKVYSTIKVNRTKRTLMKFMTIDMDSPFIHPPLPDSFEPWKFSSAAETSNYIAEATYRYGGSGFENRLYKGLEGVAQPKFPQIKTFTPKRTARALLNKAKQADNAFTD